MERLAAAVALLVLDMAWLVLAMAKPYAAMVEGIQGSPMRVQWLYAAFAYACMAVGLLVFAYPGRDESIARSVLRAALFGAVVYGTFNGTNGAVFEGWSARVAAADVAWGAFVYGCVALAVRLA